jgi:hypothetical protein
MTSVRILGSNVVDRYNVGHSGDVEYYAATMSIRTYSASGYCIVLVWPALPLYTPSF